MQQQAGTFISAGTILSALGRNWMPARDTNGDTMSGQDLFDAGRLGGAGADGDTRARKLFAHLVVNHQDVMTDLLSNLFGITASFQGLIDLRFPNSETSQIHLDFSKLRSTVEDLLGGVKRYLDLFRSHLPREIISRFEDRAKRRVSLLVGGEIDRWIDPRSTWLHKPGSGNTLENVSRKANGIFVHLTRELDFSAALVTRRTASGACAMGAIAEVASPRKTAYTNGFL